MKDRKIFYTYLFTFGMIEILMIRNVWLPCPFRIRGMVNVLEKKRLWKTWFLWLFACSLPVRILVESILIVHFILSNWSWDKIYCKDVIALIAFIYCTSYFICFINYILILFVSVKYCLLTLFSTSCAE
jgi:hypothetical protein